MRTDTCFRALGWDIENHYSETNVGKTRGANLDDGKRTDEPEFDEVSFFVGNSETGDFCPITYEMNGIKFEGEEEAESQVDPEPRYTTTLPSTTRGDKKSVDDIPLTELDPTQETDVRNLLRLYSKM